MGFAFMVAALVLFILGALGVNVPPRAELWGLACLTAGMLLGMALPWRRSPP